jgi:hypothetical protein
MNFRSVSPRRWITTVLFLCSVCIGVGAAETSVNRTNWVDRTITNVIEVRMPRNIFVNHYQTNTVEQFHTNHYVRTRTNTYERYLTNLVQRSVTNTIAVNSFHTNIINAYHTNTKTLHLTNEVAVQVLRTNFTDNFTTNLLVMQLTNQIAITAYRTNVKTLLLTNWETVLVTKTNWITQPVTNFVQVDLPARKAAAVEPRPAVKTAAPVRVEPKSAAAPAPSSPVLTEALVLAADLTTAESTNGLVEVVVRVHWAADGASSPKVQQWRIERSDGAILSFGQDQELKKFVPVGTYKVEAKVVRDDNEVLIARGTLTVTATQVLVQQRAAVKRVASANP